MCEDITFNLKYCALCIGMSEGILSDICGAAEVRV